MTKKEIPGSLANSVMLLVSVCFFLSGLTSLIYEILWTRMIVKIIGAAPFAVSIVLTVFMAGLGLGSLLAAKTIDRIAQPTRLVKIYGILELIVGTYALVIPLLLAIFEPVYAVIYNRLFSHFMLYNLLTFIGCSVILLIPVICMGATLPVLCRFYVTELSHLGTYAGRLYGLNTIGAAAGSLLCGFWLIEHLGVWGTLIFAVLTNCLIGLSCILAACKLERQQGEITAGTPPESLREVAGGDGLADCPAVVKTAMVIFAVSGFCSMAYEVIWTKLLGLIVGPTTYSFTIVLVTFILGLALGSMFFGWLADRTGRAVWLLIYTQIGAALFALVISQLFGNSQLFFTKLIFTFKDNFALLNVLKSVILFLFMILPTFCLGATFPLVGKIYTQSISRLGWSIGFAYTINTIGAVLGSFCAGFVLIPLVGKEKGLSLAVGLQLSTSLFVMFIILVAGKQKLLKHVLTEVLVIAGLIACFYFPHWDHKQLSMGKYHRFEQINLDMKGIGWLKALFYGPKIPSKYDRGKLVYYGDGVGGFTTVLEYINEFGNIDYSMANSGKMDASTRGDMMTQTLLAHFPMLFHRNPETVMVLGLASGITAGEVLHYPVDRLDVIEISPQVVEASRFFVPWNNNVLSNPKTNLIVQDGRAHLQLTQQKYDVIISEPSNPWMAGLATLFTRDFFELARDRLNEGGIFVQWFHSYQLDWPTFALVGRTFAQVFPNSILVQLSTSSVGYDYLFVGFNGKTGLSLENAGRKLICINRSKNITLADASLLYSLIVSEDLLKLFGPGPSNTDRRPRLEFAAPRLMYYHDPEITKNILTKKQLSPQTQNIIAHTTTNVDAQIDLAAYALSVYSPFPDMVDTAKATPTQKERYFKLMETYYSKNPIEDSFLFKNDEIEKKCISAQINTIQTNIDKMPDRAISYTYLALLYYREGMLNEAVLNLTKSLQLKPDDARTRYNLGLVFQMQGRYNEAISQYYQALRVSPDDENTHNNLAFVLQSLGKLDEAASHYRQSLRIKPDCIQANYNLGLILTSQGKFNDASDYFRQTIHLAPNDANMYYALANALENEGKSDEAVGHLRQALRIKPGHTPSLQKLAEILSAHPDKKSLYENDANTPGKPQL